MKNLKTLTAFLILSLSACNNPQATNDETSKINPGAAPSDASGESLKESCYRSKTGNSIVEMTLTEKDGLVQGTLNYMPEAKDKNTGIVKGRMRGDTLLADYTFMSEGMESVREVMFLKTAEGYKEGYGPVKDLNGKMVFEDPTAADFSKSATLIKVDCNSGKL